MQYSGMVEGRFLNRPNRFIAMVEIGGREETCHVKNTGRCRELLKPGAQIWCAAADNPKRKTKYDLIAVRKGGYMVNMDSQAPNAAVKEWLLAGGMHAVTVKPEQFYGASRFDFFLERLQPDGTIRPMYLEVKGVTLENGGVCRFPDAPTERGARHLRELIQAKAEGFDAGILFVIQMKPVKCLMPNDATDPMFAQALRAAAAAGVEVLAMDCVCTPDTMRLDAPVPVVL